MDKMYRIGKAADLLGLNTSVLRYWETEFPQVVPVRTEKGQRLYTEEHLYILRRIQELLYKEGLTIEGAKKRLNQAVPVETVTQPSLPFIDTAFSKKDFAEQVHKQAEKKAAQAIAKAKEEARVSMEALQAQTDKAVARAEEEASQTIEEYKKFLQAAEAEAQRQAAKERDEAIDKARKEIRRKIEVIQNEADEAVARAQDGAWQAIEEYKKKAQVTEEEIRSQAAEETAQAVIKAKEAAAQEARLAMEAVQTQADEAVARAQEEAAQAIEEYKNTFESEGESEKKDYAASLKEMQDLKSYLRKELLEIQALLKDQNNEDTF